MMLFSRPSSSLLFLSVFLRILQCTAMKDPSLHVTNEPRMILHVPELQRESRTAEHKDDSLVFVESNYSNEYTESGESTEQVESNPGILLSEESTAKSVIDDKFIHGFLRNISSWHGVIRKASESMQKGTSHFTGIGRPKTLLPPGQKRRRRVHKTSLNRTRPHVSSNPHIFAREGGDMAFGLKYKKKEGFGGLVDNKMMDHNGERSDIVTSRPTRGPVTFAPPVYKPRNAIVKLAPDLEDLRSVGLIKHHEYEKLKKDKSLTNATPIEIMKMKDQIADETPETDIQIPNYLVTTLQPNFLNRNFVHDSKFKDDNVALYVETEYSPTYSIPPHVLHSLGYQMPNFEFRKYNLSSLNEFSVQGREEQQNHLHHSTLSIPLSSPSYFNSHSPTASSFIPPIPTPSVGHSSSTSYSHSRPHGPPLQRPQSQSSIFIPSPLPSTPRHVYQPPRTYTLSTTPKHLSGNTPSSRPSNSAAYTLSPGKAFMPPVVTFTTFQPLAQRDKHINTENVQNAKDLLRNLGNVEEDTDEHLAYPPGIFSPIPPTLPPSDSYEAVDKSHDLAPDGFSRDNGRNLIHQQPNELSVSPPPFRSVYRPPPSPPVPFPPPPPSPPLQSHSQQPTRPPFPNSAPYPPTFPTHTSSPILTPTHPPIPHSPPHFHNTVPPFPAPIPPSIPPRSIHTSPKTYHLTTARPTTQRFHVPPKPTKLPNSSERRDKTLLNYNHRHWEPKQPIDYESPIPKYPQNNVFHRPKPIIVLPVHLQNLRPEYGRAFPPRKYPAPTVFRKPQLFYGNTESNSMHGPINNEISHVVIPGVPGIANKDYPAYSVVPRTSFTCYGKIIGYYADPEAQCQVFHMCEFGNRKSSFLCPNGTLFNQQIVTCDHWRNVDCANAVSFYQINEKIYAAQEKKTYPYRRKKHTKARSHKLLGKDVDNETFQHLESSSNSRHILKTTSAAPQPVVIRSLVTEAASDVFEPLVTEPPPDLFKPLITEPGPAIFESSVTERQTTVVKSLVTEYGSAIFETPATKSKPSVSKPLSIGFKTDESKLPSLSEALISELRPVLSLPFVTEPKAILPTLYRTEPQSSKTNQTKAKAISEPIPHVFKPLVTDTQTAISTHPNTDTPLVTKPQFKPVNNVPLRSINSKTPIVAQHQRSIPTVPSPPSHLTSLYHHPSPHRLSTQSPSVPPLFPPLSLPSEPHLSPPPIPLPNHIQESLQSEFQPVIQSMKPHFVNPLKVKPFVP